MFLDVICDTSVYHSVVCMFDVTYAPSAVCTWFLNYLSYFKHIRYFTICLYPFKIVRVKMNMSNLVKYNSIISACINSFFPEALIPMN